MEDIIKRPRAYDFKDGKVVFSANRIEIQQASVADLRIGTLTHDQLRAIIREEIAATAPAEVTLQVDNRLSMADLIRRASQASLHALHSPRRR